MREGVKDLLQDLEIAPKVPVKSPTKVCGLLGGEAVIMTHEVAAAQVVYMCVPVPPTPLPACAAATASAIHRPAGELGC